MKPTWNEKIEGLHDRKASDYAKLRPDDVRELKTAARALKGMNVLHLNATPVGGGIAELLNSQVSIERSLGIKSRWLTIEADESFFGVTKKIHDLLQGGTNQLTTSERRLYLETNRELGHELNSFLRRQKINAGTIVFHDPQTLMAAKQVSDSYAKIARLHIDLTDADSATMRMLKPGLDATHRTTLSAHSYADSLPRPSHDRIDIIAPAIDPMTEKNSPMRLPTAKKILCGFGIDVDRPILTQVSRFDPWKDPIGVIKAYREAKKSHPKLQLILAGLTQAKDDPTAIGMIRKTTKTAGEDPDIHIFHDPGMLGGVTNDKLINAILTCATVVVQNSKREGFGLTMTEAMWKGKALVARKSTGACLQIEHGANGIISKSPKETAAAIKHLLGSEKERARLGSAAKQSVSERFLMPGYVLHSIRSYRSAQKQKKLTPQN